MSRLVRQTETLFLAFTLVVLGFLAETEAQMEKRNCELYLMKEFKEARPAIGSTAPDLALVTCNGAKVKLSDFLGKPIVIVKGGYT